MTAHRCQTRKVLQSRAPGFERFGRPLLIMGDLKSSRLIVLKGFLFLFTGTIAASVLLGENFSWRTAFLLAIAIWSFCRFYYFAFYVLERYVDPTFKFSSLWAFAVYFWKRWRGKPN